MANNKQQTPVDFFYDEVWACFSSNLSWSECELLKKIKDLAKVMEKEQAIKLYYEYELYVMMNESDVMTFGQFYKQTYGGNEQ